MDTLYGKLSNPWFEIRGVLRMTTIWKTNKISFP